MIRWFAPVLFVCSLLVLITPRAFAAQSHDKIAYPGLTFHQESKKHLQSLLHTSPLKLIFGENKKDKSITIAQDMPVPEKVTQILPLPTVPDDLISPNLQQKVVILTKEPSPTPSLPSPSPTKKVTAKLASTTQLPTLAPTPTTQPTVTPQPVQVVTSTGIPQNPTGGLNAEKLFNLVNNYHMSKGYASYQTDSRACELASARAAEVGEEIANGHMHSGLRARNLPYWNSENIISYNSEEGAFNWWINDTIHREQIEADYKYSCLACVGNSCAQEFTNFVLK